MPKNKLIKATKDSFAQFHEGLISREELDDQLKRLGEKSDSKSVLDIFLDNLYKEFDGML